MKIESLTKEQIALLRKGDVHKALDVLLYACFPGWEQEMPSDILPHEAKFKEAVMRAQYVIANGMKDVIEAADLPERRVTELLANLLAVSAPAFRNSMARMRSTIPA